MRGKHCRDWRHSARVTAAGLSALLSRLPLPSACNNLLTAGKRETVPTTSWVLERFAEALFADRYPARTGNVLPQLRRKQVVPQAASTMRSPNSQTGRTLENV